MFTITFGRYEVLCLYDGLPALLDEYVRRAVLAERIQLDDHGNGEGKLCFVAVRADGDAWPRLVVTQRYRPADGVFFPGVLIVPETRRMFLGAGTRLLCYDLAAPARLREDTAECAFWFWRYDGGGEVFMGAELELAAFDVFTGAKLWTHYVEPPWELDLTPDFARVTMAERTACVDRRRGPNARA